VKLWREKWVAAEGALLIGDLLDRSAREGSILTLVDGKDSFDPDPFTEAQCQQLLWLRCRDASQALQATDLLLRDGNLAGHSSGSPTQSLGGNPNVAPQHLAPLSRPGRTIRSRSSRP